MRKTRKNTRSRKSNKAKITKNPSKKLLTLLKKCDKKCSAYKRYTKFHRDCLKKNCKKLVKVVKVVSRKTKKGGKMRGGYGKGACPFVGAPWTGGPLGGEYYFKYNQNGIGVGGVQPFSGNQSPSPQHSGGKWRRGGKTRRQRGGSGGLWQQLVLNPYRGAVGGLGDVHNTYAGRALLPSPYPQYQDQVTPQTFDVTDVYKN